MCVWLGGGGGELQIWFCHFWTWAIIAFCALLVNYSLFFIFFDCLFCFQYVVVMWWLPGVESVPWCVTLTSPAHSPLPETTSLKLQTTSSSPLLVRLESVPSYVYSVVLVKFSLIAHCIVFNAVRAYPMSFKFPCWFFVLFFWKKHLNKCAQNIAIVMSMPETLLASMPQILPYEVLVHPL